MWLKYIVISYHVTIMPPTFTKIVRDGWMCVSFTQDTHQDFSEDTELPAVPFGADIDSSGSPDTGRPKTTFSCYIYTDLHINVSSRIKAGTWSFHNIPCDCKTKSREKRQN